MTFDGSHVIILILCICIYPTTCAPKPQVINNPIEDPNAICPPDTIYVNGTCIRRCPGSTLPTDDSCVQCPPDSEYSNGQCVQCNEGMLLKDGRCTCPPRMALLNGECVNIKMQQCRENEILSEGKCIPLFCYGNRCCKTLLCNACFLSCQQLTKDTATLSKCQGDCINDISPSIPPFMVEVEQAPVLPSVEVTEPPRVVEATTFSNEIPLIIVNQPSPPIFTQPGVYPPTMVNQPSFPIYTKPNVQSPIIVNRPSSPIYTKPNVYSPIIVNRPSPPIYTQPKVFPPIVVSRPPPPVVIQPNPLPPVILSQPNPQILEEQQVPLIVYQQSSKPAQLITGTKSNSTTVMKITNIVNNTNLENVNTRINNTNINHVKLGSSSSNDFEVSMNGVESNQEVIKREECCIITEPRVCLNATNKVVCYHKRHHVCGDRCLQLTEESVESEREAEEVILNPSSNHQQIPAYSQQPIYFQQPSYQNSYVPQYYQQPIFMQPQLSYQPQGGMCSYIPQWPYVSC